LTIPNVKTFFKTSAHLLEYFKPISVGNGGGVIVSSRRNRIEHFNHANKRPRVADIAYG